MQRTCGIVNAANCRIRWGATICRSVCLSSFWYGGALMKAIDYIVMC